MTRRKFCNYSNSWINVIDNAIVESISVSANITGIKAMNLNYSYILVERTE